MDLITKDGEMFVLVGSPLVLRALYSTAALRLGVLGDQIAEALAFLNTGCSSSAQSREALIQMELVRSGLSMVGPGEAVFDLDDLSRKAPWDGLISDSVTSCANMFTTSDGKNLILELERILTYSADYGVDIIAQ